MFQKFSAEVPRIVFLIFVLSITGLISQNKFEWRPLSVTERLFCQFLVNPEQYTEVFEIYHGNVKSYDYTIIKSSDINPDFDSLITFSSFNDSLNYYAISVIALLVLRYPGAFIRWLIFRRQTYKQYLEDDLWINAFSVAMFGIFTLAIGMAIYELRFIS